MDKDRGVDFEAGRSRALEILKSSDKESVWLEAAEFHHEFSHQFEQTDHDFIDGLMSVYNEVKN